MDLSPCSFFCECAKCAACHVASQSEEAASFIRLQIIVDDGAELASVRCSIDLDAVYFVNVELRLKLKLPACGDRMAAGNPAVLKVETSAAMLV